MRLILIMNCSADVEKLKHKKRMHSILSLALTSDPSEYVLMLITYRLSLASLSIALMVGA